MEPKRKKERGSKSERKRGGKHAKAASGAMAEEGEGEEGEEEEEEEEEEDDDDEEEDDEDEDEDEDGDGEGDEFKASKKTRTEVAALATRKTSARASKSGVSALTSQLRQEGMLAMGEEDAEGGGEREDERARGGRRGAAGGAQGSSAAAGGGGGGGLEDLQVLALNAERISIPELLFSPQDAGLGQPGLPAAIAAAIAACPAQHRPALWSSIVLTGGGARMPGLEARLARELRQLAPSGVHVVTYTPREPQLAAWRGGSALAALPQRMQRVCVTKQMWAEEGPARCAARLASGGDRVLLG